MQYYNDSGIIFARGAENERAIRFEDFKKVLYLLIYNLVLPNGFLRNPDENNKARNLSKDHG